MSKRKLKRPVCLSGRFGCVGVRSGGRAFGRLVRLRKVSVNVSSNAFMVSPDDLAAWACGQMLLPSREPDARSEKVFKTIGISSKKSKANVSKFGWQALEKYPRDVPEVR